MLFQCDMIFIRNKTEFTSCAFIENFIASYSHVASDEILTNFGQHTDWVQKLTSACDRLLLINRIWFVLATIFWIFFSLRIKIYCTVCNAYASKSITNSCEQTISRLFGFALWVFVFWKFSSLSFFESLLELSPDIFFLLHTSRFMSFRFDSSIIKVWFASMLVRLWEAWCKYNIKLFPEDLSNVHSSFLPLQTCSLYRSTIDDSRWLYMSAGCVSSTRWDAQLTAVHVDYCIVSWVIIQSHSLVFFF